MPPGPSPGPSPGGRQCCSGTHLRHSRTIFGYPQNQPHEIPGNSSVVGFEFPLVWVRQFRETAKHMALFRDEGWDHHCHEKMRKARVGNHGRPWESLTDSIGQELCTQNSW